MKVTTLCISNGNDSVGSILNACDLVEKAEFPVFKKCFTESKQIELERWGREHKDLAIQQDAFMLNLLCKVYCEILEVLTQEETGMLAAKMSHAFDSLIAQRQIQYIRISKDLSGSDPLCTFHPITAVYQYMASMKIHTIHISNVPYDQ